MKHLTVLSIDFDLNGETQTLFFSLLHDEQNLMLIDCGYPGSLEKIEQAAQQTGMDMARLTHILITHHDFDHMGDLARLKARYPNARVLSSPNEVPFIEGACKSLRLEQAEALFDSLPESMKPGALAFAQMLAAVVPAKVDQTVEEAQEWPLFGGIRFIATPGHMPGHLSVYLPNSRTLIAGDAVVVESGKLAIANPHYTLDLPAAKASLAKLAGLAIDRIVCYHGGIFEGNIKTALERLAQT